MWRRFRSVSVRFGQTPTNFDQTSMNSAQNSSELGHVGQKNWQTSTNTCATSHKLGPVSTLRYTPDAGQNWLELCQQLPGTDQLSPEIDKLRPTSVGHTCPNSANIWTNCDPILAKSDPTGEAVHLRAFLADPKVPKGSGSGSSAPS